HHLRKSVDDFRVVMEIRSGASKCAAERLQLYGGVAGGGTVGVDNGLCPVGHTNLKAVIWAKQGPKTAVKAISVRVKVKQGLDAFKRRLSLKNIGRLQSVLVVEKA